MNKNDYIDWKRLNKEKEEERNEIKKALGERPSKKPKIYSKEKQKPGSGAVKYKGKKGEKYDHTEMN